MGIRWQTLLLQHQKFFPTLAYVLSHEEVQSAKLWPGDTPTRNHPYIYKLVI